MDQHLSISSFKQTALVVLKLILFIGILVPVVSFLGEEYKKASKENLINEYNKQRFNDFYSAKEGSVDVVFIGSSHSYCTFDPAIIDAEAGTVSYQMGMPLQLPASTYYELKDILSRQKPKTVVMEVFWNVLSVDFQLNQATQLFQVMDNEKLKDEYIEKVFPIGEKIKYSFDVLKYQSDYFAYKSNEYDTKIRNFIQVYRQPEEKQEGTEKYGTRGFIYCDYHMLESEYGLTNQFTETDGKDYKISPVQQKYLDKIAELCSDEGIQLIFVTAPVAPVSMSYIKNYDMIYHKIKAIADKHNIPYFDYNIINEEENLVTNENFRDDAHLNYSGVEIIDRHFLKLLGKEGISLK